MHWAESQEWQDCKAPEVPENRKHPSKIVKWGPKAEAEEVFARPQGAMALCMPLSIASLILLGSDTRGMNGMQLNGRGSSPLTGFAKQPLVKPLGLAKFECCPIQNIKSTQALRTESKWYHHQYSGKTCQQNSWIRDIPECPRRGRFEQFQPAHQTLMRLTNRPWTASKAAATDSSEDSSIKI